MGFGPTTSCLASRHSTPELRPLGVSVRREYTTNFGYGKVLPYSES